MSLVESVRQVFAQDGVLASATDGFSPRAGQTDMAVAVAGVLQTGGVLVVEAGTGVGKTFAYLVPALLSGQRVLLSTATKTLQDQLFGRDLPRLVKALGLPVRLALLKGRGSYLCLHRLELARHEVSAADRRALAKVEQWAQATRSGDLAEVPGLDERSPIIPLVTSTRENCLGSPCPKFRNCHVNLARREALGADIVVVNHHLFFADLAVRESGMAELLPTVRAVVFDEAHQLNETGVQFLGNQLGTAQLLDLTRDLLAAGLQLARGLVDWSSVAGALEHSARELRLVVGKTWGQTRLRWVDGAPDQIDAAAWQQALQDVADACKLATAALDTVSEIAPDFVRLHERASGLGERALLFLQPCELGCVRWLDVGAQLRLVQSPLDIAQAVQTRLLKPPPPAADDAEPVPARSFVFTSATLGDEPKLTWFTEPCGLQAAQVLQVSSPFDYARQAALYVPRHLVRPNDPNHSAQVAQIAGDAAASIGGRTLVLTTTLKALRAVGQALQERFKNDSGLSILIQGELPKRRLMELFQRGNQDGAPGCVLVASASFWEGFDVPGDALQVVVIDKLPFPPPNDPLVEARSQRLEAQGRNSFSDYSLPEAAVALKQGAGRLIRTETDRGILVVCDTRLVGMSYGRRLMDSLPPMQRLTTQAQWEDALAALKTASAHQAITTLSTTDPDWL